MIRMTTLTDRELLELLAQAHDPKVRQALMELSALRGVTGELDAALTELRRRLKEWNVVGEALLKDVKEARGHGL